MKYECTIIIYKENKHMNVSYNVKKTTIKKCLFNEMFTGLLVQQVDARGNSQNHNSVLVCH